MLQKLLFILLGLLLFNNFDLYTQFYKYVHNIESDMQPFYNFLEKQDYEFSEAILSDFIKSVQKDK